MIKTILNLVSGANALTSSGRLTQFDADGLLIDLKVAGAPANMEAYFDTCFINATLKGEAGKDSNIIQAARLGDLLRASDFGGGASMASEGDAGDRYIAYVPLGNLMLEGDDILDLSLTLAGSAVFNVDALVSACDFVKADEEVRGYESIEGNGSEILIRDATTVYLMSAETGATISVRDQEREYFVTDREIIASGNALGKMEVFETCGVLYSEGSGYGQDVRIKLPLNAKALVCRLYYPLDRVGLKAASGERKIASLREMIRINNPDKYNYLAAKGLMG